MTQAWCRTWRAEGSDEASGMSIDLLKSRRTSQAWEINGDILLFRVEQSHLVH